MREWRDGIIEILTIGNAGRVMEIGCGTGLLGLPLLRAGWEYVGIDNSPRALSRLSGLSAHQGFPLVLHEGEALDAGDLCDSQFDLVLLNSVCQYFPDAAYFAYVLEIMISLCGPGRRVFIGDVRPADMLEIFAAERLTKLRGNFQTKGRLKSDALQLALQERELTLGAHYFHELAKSHPKVSGVACHLRRGVHANELTKYRFDVSI